MYFKRSIYDLSGDFIFSHRLCALAPLREFKVSFR
jgi:hypothetical protein